MPAFWSYLIGLALVAAWIRLRPLRSIRQAFLHWVVGVALLRPIPEVIELALRRSSGWTHTLPIWLSLAGAVLITPALWYLVHLERVRDRKLLWFRILFALAILLPSVTKGNPAGAALLAIPLLTSFRWRFQLGAGSLLLANIVAAATVLLHLVRFGDVPIDARERFAGILQFASFISSISVFYALMSLPLTGSRIHLSIRNIGRRLIGSHLLASLIPFTLGVTFLLVSGALFLSTDRSLIGARMLKENIAAASRLLESRLVAGEAPVAQPFGTEAAHQTVYWQDSQGETHVLGDPPPMPVDSLLTIDSSPIDAPLLWAGGRLWLRARATLPAAAGLTSESGAGLPHTPVRVDALAQLDSLWLSRISRTAGESVRLFPGITVLTRGAGLQVNTGGGRSSEEVVAESGESDSTSLRRLMHPIGPPKRPGWRIPGGATLNCIFSTDHGWDRRPVPIASWAGLGEQVRSLFSSPRENPFSLAVILALGVIAALFLGTIGIVTGMVLEMGRSITRAVQALTEGTRALQAGKLDHRIQVHGNDELWHVADSFNEMAEGLEKIRTMELAQQRLEEELRLARAIQTRLLPAAPPRSDRIELAGLSLPAREVGGDYYDYLQLEDGRIGVAVADVSGKGTPAALLMSAFRAALRSQDLGRLGPAEALGRINRFIHESVDPGKFITAFLALINPETGEVRYANAGHDAPIVLKPDGSSEELTGGGLILGMLPQIVYEQAGAVLEPGSLLTVFTDGVTEARSEDGEFFGPERLIELLRQTRTGACSEILQRLVGEIERFGGDGPQADDITIILARRR